VCRDARRDGLVLADDFPEGHFTHGHPYGIYEQIRAEGGVLRHPRLPLWAVGSHAAVQTVLADPDTFRSRDGILIHELDVAYDSPPTIMHTDPPEHTRYRSLVAPAFRPSVVRGLESTVRDRVRTLLDAIPQDRPYDLVSGLAEPLPLQVICLMLGIPEDDWPRFSRWSDAIVPDVVEMPEDERNALRMEAGGYLLAEAHRRREQPRDDVISRLATIEVDGDRLTDLELVMFLIQLLVAGNETTRHAISGGFLALAEHPDQWAALRNRPGLVPSAVEEILRWTSPVAYFLRTAARPTVLGKVEVAEGDRVMLLYGAATRDPDVYGPTADRFLVERAAAQLNLAFGFGPHFCLGAALARMELRILLEESIDRFRVLNATGTRAYNGSSVVTGLRRCDMAFTR
jgi:cytochrome P450